MFKFNFNVSNEEDSQSFTFSDAATNDNRKEKNLEYECEEIKIDQDKLDNLNIYENISKKFLKNGLEISYIDSENLEEIPKNSASDIIKADINHSDLMPGIYEGGAKIWECTEDLIEYFLENKNVDYFKEKSILDLGCGVGLLGIFALKQNAHEVCFQDYNKDVIENITIPNVLLNIDNPNLEINEQYKFYSGDWKNFTEFTDNEEKFDVILTSETIYNSENHKKLLDVFDSRLKLNGIIFLAAKTYYFGIGGGLRQFEDLINVDKRFQSNSIWSTKIGVCREILKIQRNITTNSS